MSSTSSTRAAPGILLLVSCLLVARLPGGESPRQPGPASRATDAERAELVAGNNQFTCDLLAQLAAAEPGNLFISALSIRTALAMTYVGAKGATAAQMRQALGFTLPDDRLHTAMGEAIAGLNAVGRGRPEVAVANSLWAARDYPFLPEFIAHNKASYGATLELVDFRAATEATRRRINGWVADRTRRKIQDLIPPDSLDADSVLVLVNAVYFKGTWAAPFVAARTKPATWDSGPKKVQLMQRDGEYGYAQQRLIGADGAGDVQILELPYAGDTMSMLVLLPPPGTALADMVRDLTAAKLATAVAALRPQEVQVGLPRFSITWGSKDFGPKGLGVLPALGMQDAFLPTADFSGMNGSGALCIGKVLHKAFVEVQEKGTTAAAATAVEVISIGMPSDPAVFRADRPFLFFIRERKDGMILFAGRMESP